MNGDTGQEKNRVGEIIAVRDNGIDVRFPPPLPPRNQELRTGFEDRVILEVQTHLDTRTVRCIALNSTRRLGRGMPVRDTGSIA